MSAALLPALLLAAAPAAVAPDGAAPDAGGAGTYLLRYKFEADGSIRYRVDTAGRTEAKMKANDQLVRQSGSTVQRLDVLEAPAAGNAPGAAHDAPAGLIRIYSESIALSARFDENPPTAWDSASGEPAPEEFSQVAKMVGRPMCDLTVTAGGEVVAAAKRLPGEPAETVDPVAYRDLFPKLPEGRVAVGDRWEDLRSVKVKVAGLPTPWKVRRRFTLESVEGGVATIAVTVTPLPPPADVKVRQQLAGRCPGGTVTFDISRGIMLSQKAVSDDRIINFQGPGTMLHVTADHDQRLLKAGPTAELTAEAPAARVAAGPAGAAE